MSSFLMCFFYAFKILLEIRVATQTWLKDFIFTAFPGEPTISPTSWIPPLDLGHLGGYISCDGCWFAARWAESSSKHRAAADGPEPCGCWSSRPGCCSGWLPPTGTCSGSGAPFPWSRSDLRDPESSTRRRGTKSSSKVGGRTVWNQQKSDGKTV